MTRFGGRSTRPWLGVVAVAGVAAFAEGARADATDARDVVESLEWSAPDGCPSAGDLRAEVGRLLGESGTQGARVAIEGRIAAREGGVLQLELVLESAEGRATRVIEATSCDALVQAGALVIALAIDPDAVVSRAEDVPDAVDLEVLRAIDGENGEGLSAPGGQLVTPASPYRIGVRPRVPPPVADVRGTFFVGAAFDAGTLPKPTFGIEAGGGVRIRGLELTAAFRWLSERSQSVASSPAGGEFVLYASRVRACGHASLADHFELAPCALAELGTLRGRGFGVADPGAGAAPWLALGVGVVARVAWRWASVDLRLDGAAPLIRTRYVLDGVGAVHRASSVGFHGGVVVSTFFP